MHAKETSTVLNEIRALILDECQVCTFKFVAKKFHVRYDESKQLLYQYQQEQGDAVDVTYLLSGILKDPKHADQSTRSYVVKIVPANDLNASKATFAEIDSLHVYSLSPKGVMTPENLVEVDLSLSREALGTTLGADYATLGRVSLASAPEHRVPGAGRRPSAACPKSQKTAKSQDRKVSQERPKTVGANVNCANVLSHDRQEAEVAVSGRKEGEDARKNAVATVKQAEQKRKAPASAAAKPEAKKKRAQVIDSDEDEDEPGASEAVKVTTYINDKGEEVTEIQQGGIKGGPVSEDKAQMADKKADKKADKNSDKNRPGAKIGKGQKGIMGFFKPKQ